MISPEEWSEQRSQLLLTGQETHPHFNIARQVGEYAVLDLVLLKRKRLLCYPQELHENVLPAHPTLMPYKTFSEGNLGSKGIVAVEVPSGTVPILRVAQSFDTPESGALKRADIFHDAGQYVARHWGISEHKVPEGLGLRMLSYIRIGGGEVAYVPPQKFVDNHNPTAAFAEISNQIMRSGLRPDAQELAYQFDRGIKDIMQSQG